MALPVYNIGEQFYTVSGSFGFTYHAEWYRKHGKHIQVEWVHCREEFQEASSKIRHFLFWHGAGTQKRVIKFINRVQDDLKLKKKDRLQLGKTSDDRVVYIVMSSFWRQEVRRSLLTALLRAGPYYKNKKCYKSAMKEVDYLADTMPAVEQFLKGHTHLRHKYKKNFWGWYFTLSDLSEAEMRDAMRR